MKVSFIIPNYNGSGLIQKNIPKVFEAALDYASDSGRFVQIIIIDDFSTDDSVIQINKFIKKFKKSYIDIILIEHDKNKGFSSAVNDGSKVASGDLLVLLNTDAYPKISKGFIRSFVHFFDDKKLFAVGFMDESIEEDGSIVLRGRGGGRWRRGFLQHWKGEVNSNDTLWVNGGSSVYRREIWNKLGGMNEIYNPFYWEDIDLSYRAVKSGYLLRFEPKCVVVHEHEKGAIKSSKSEFTIQRTAYRNQFFFVWLNVTDITIIISHIFWLPYYFIKTLSKGDFAFLLGFILALVNLKAVIIYRRSNNPSFVLTDKQVTCTYTNYKN